MKKKEIEQLIIVIDEYARNELSHYRYEHSVRVAVMAQRLATHYKCSKKMILLAYLAGIAHDICKEKKETFLLNTALRDGKEVDMYELEDPDLLHGRAAAIILKEKFEIKKKSLLRAVRHHTFGSVKLDELGYILYVADKIEPGRKNASRFRESFEQMSLDELTCSILKDSMDYIEKKGKKVHPRTKKMYKQLLKTVAVDTVHKTSEEKKD